MYALASLEAPSLLRGRRGTMCTAKGSDVRPGVPWVSTCFTWEVWVNVHCQGVRNLPWQAWNMYLLIYLIIHSPTHARTRAVTHFYTHTHTQSLTHSRPPALTHPLPHFHFTSFTPLHFTSLTHSHTSPSSCAIDVYQPPGMQKEFTKCAAALGRVQNIIWEHFFW